ncbi:MULTISPECIES: YqaE/Pmp3 family membrane protein [Pseudoalteromonas]|uniref:YqaE/Pmp3 family membrane protein n=1 Tax=Pseudoalteromonas obscura TaxID=3048491 RepID=A0ABT7EE78_9GAMM|nr:MULTISPECIES: YqaE/Pmp3 family membrane protein [Pseudoalteromonas]MBQ4838528.1 YqaE/Pmp3 family membrane protein [Pseudoalteromonas luteoviolacea]MDK2593572.1 YqaE/Pmp3 family membrane protein [Pseudoalteromonas sp. P94(2023)]
MSSNNVSIVNLIFAIFLPPIGAFLQVGFSAHFFINIVLTLLGGLPGMIHAIWLVVTNKTGD